MGNAATLRNIEMHFNKSSEKIESFKEYFLKLFKGGLYFEDFTALKDISADIKRGEVFGIIGLNGSGKSTLLKIISGILTPTKGEVLVEGSVAPLIELGAGFDMELTARENIYLNGAVLGYSKAFIKENFDSIVEFAEIGDFLDTPMKNYSTGMVARIAFAIATVTKPDILLIDEILSVGDFLFQEKCEQRINSMINENTTVILVSHSIEQIERMCDRVMWLEKGNIKMLGQTEEVCTKYRELGFNV